MASSIVFNSRSIFGTSKIPPELDDALAERLGIERREVNSSWFSHRGAEKRACGGPWQGRSGRWRETQPIGLIG
jgi:hypothetical protein